MGIWSDIKRMFTYPAGTHSGESIRAAEERAAAARWREHNRRAREAGCPCGEPATEVNYVHGTVGGVPMEVWTCKIHEGMSSWTTVGASFTPYWDRFPACAGHGVTFRCGGHSSTISTGQITSYSCPLRPDRENDNG